MHKDQFLEEVAFRLRNYFKASKEGHKSDVERHRIEGFMEAGVFFNSCTYQEINRVMENTHLDVWGKSIKERKIEASKSYPSETTDYAIYETPAIDRKHNK